MDSDCDKLALAQLAGELADAGDQIAAHIAEIRGDALLIGPGLEVIEPQLPLGQPARQCRHQQRLFSSSSP